MRPVSTLRSAGVASLLLVWLVASVRVPPAAAAAVGPSGTATGVREGERGAAPVAMPSDGRGRIVLERERFALLEDGRSLSPRGYQGLVFLEDGGFLTFHVPRSELLRFSRNGVLERSVRLLTPEGRPIPGPAGPVLAASGGSPTGGPGRDLFLAGADGRLHRFDLDLVLGATARVGERRPKRTVPLRLARARARRVRTLRARSFLAGDARGVGGAQAGALHLFDLTAGRVSAIEDGRELFRVDIPDLSDRASLYVGPRGETAVVDPVSHAIVLLARPTAPDADERVVPVRLEGDRVAVSRGSHLFVLNRDARTVEKRDRTGDVLSRFGPSPGGAEGPFPIDFALSREDALFLLDDREFRVYGYAPSGERKVRFGGFGATPGRFSSPRAIHVDRLGRVLVRDVGKRRVLVFAQDGRFLEEWADLLGSGLGSEFCVAADPGNRLHAIDFARKDDAAFPYDFDYLRALREFAADPERYPVGSMTLDPDGRLRLFDEQTQRLVVLSPGGRVTVEKIPEPESMVEDADGGASEFRASALALLTDGTLVAGDREGRLAFVPREGGRVAEILRLPAAVREVSTDPFSNLVVVTSAEVSIWTRRGVQRSRFGRACNASGAVASAAPTGPGVFLGLVEPPAIAFASEGKTPAHAWRLAPGDRILAAASLADPARGEEASFLVANGDRLVLVRCRVVDRLKEAFEAYANGYYKEAARALEDLLAIERCGPEGGLLAVLAYRRLGRDDLADRLLSDLGKRYPSADLRLAGDRSSGGRPAGSVFSKGKETSR